MPWHPFTPTEGYDPQIVVKTCEQYLNSGAIKDVREKAGYLESIEQCREKLIYFHPVGSGWGASPFNLRAWRAEHGTSAFDDYRTQTGRRKPWTKADREHVFAKTKGHCCVCGIEMEQAGDWQIQHIIPFSLGGSNNYENLLPICGPCNLFSSNYTPKYVRRMCDLGYALIREVEKETELGIKVRNHMDDREVRLAKNRDARARRK